MKDKQALREAAERAKDSFIPNFMVPTRDVLALLDELEHYKSREERVTKLVLDNSTSWDAHYKKLEAAEKRTAELERANVAKDDHINQQQDRIEQLEKGHQEAAKQINSWRRLAKQNIAERGKDISELEAARQRIAELEARKAKPVMFIDGDISPADADKLAAVIRGFNEEIEPPAARMARIIRENPHPTNMCDMAATGIDVKQKQDSVDSDAGSRNQPGMVVAVHIDAGDFVKIKGQVFEVEETDFDDHDVTLWFVGGNALKCSAGCLVEVVSEPVAAGIKVKVNDCE
ncbi:ead/Ea22-like family protein [Salmonella enterica]|uniref:ead/Ea22-like family protein n=1 Tax=Salmonella enterica TaxID=28901 RepID=UPI0009AE53B3|nr:ead/Ea22-like family protein [Salmonella enterica]